MTASSPTLAGVLLALTLYQIFKKRVRLGVRTARLFYLDKKELIMSARSRRALAVAGGILALLLVLPMARRTIRSEAVLRPAGVHHVDAPGDGVVERVFVSEGDDVAAGAELLRIVNPAAQAESARFSAESARMAGRESAARQAGDAWAVAEAEGLRTAAAAGLEKAVGAQDRLSIKSPIVGRVLTARPADLVGNFVTAGRPLARGRGLLETRRGAPGLRAAPRRSRRGRAGPGPARPAPDPAGPRHDRPHLAGDARPTRHGARAPRSSPALDTARPLRRADGLRQCRRRPPAGRSRARQDLFRARVRAFARMARPAPLAPDDRLVGKEKGPA